MSERNLRANSETTISAATELPSRDEVIASYRDKRSTLVRNLEEVRSRSGVILNSNEILQKQNEERSLTSELRGVEDIWSGLGGAELDAAQAGVDALNFKSDAIDHIRAKKRLQAAKDALYANYVAESTPTSSPMTIEDTKSRSEELVVEREVQAGADDRHVEDEPSVTIGRINLEDGSEDSVTIEKIPLDDGSDDAADSLQDESGAEPLENEPAEEEPRLWYRRVKDVFGRAKEQLYDRPGRWVGGRLASMGALNRNEGETDEEYEKRREKRGKAAIALGYGALVATAAFATYKVVSGIGSNSGMEGVGTLDIDIPTPPDGDPTNTGTEATQPVVDSTGDTQEVVNEFSEQARHVDQGEGGGQTLSEMDVPASDHERVWEQVGQRLQESGRGDLVYRMDDGRWGWSQSGALDQESLEVIAEAIRDNR